MTTRAEEGRIIRTVRDHRAKLNRRFKRKQGVWATALGLKRTNSLETNELCLTVFVDKKLPESRLAARSDKVQAETRVGDVRITTDVVPIPRLVSQSMAAPTAIYDGKELGTLSGFARSVDGNIFGISCAHCLLGADSDIQTPAPVEFFSAPGGWAPVGTTATSLYHAGRGTPRDFGLFDAGLIRIRSPRLRTYVLGLDPGEIYAAPRSATQGAEFLHMEVMGIGARSNTLHEARVSHVWAEAVNGTDFRADLLVMREDGGFMTQPGDSGMLWMDPMGASVAIHAMGEPGPSSRFSVCMFADRVATRLGVTLLDWP